MTHPVTLIAAVGRNGAIGLRDSLPWRLPSDLKRFKALTMGKPVVMGRKTFASIGRPLAGRHLVVVSRQRGLTLPDGVERASGVDEALGRAEALAVLHGADEVIVAGGSEIYLATIGCADRLRLTTVDLSPVADATFPPIDPASWREVRREVQIPSPGDEAGFAYVDYARRSRPAEPDRLSVDAVDAEGRLAEEPSRRAAFRP